MSECVVIPDHRAQRGFSCRILTPSPHPTLQVFSEPAIPEEAMVTVVNDWMDLYLNYYKKKMVGEQEEQDKALQELRQELNTLSASFLDKYRNFLKSL